MSQSVSGGDATTVTGDDLEQNFDGSTDSNDEERLPITDYTKGKLHVYVFLRHTEAIQCLSNKYEIEVLGNYSRKIRFFNNASQ